MTEPHWPNVTYKPIDYQNVIYYSAPKNKTKLASLDDADPKLIETYQKLGIPLNEQKLLAGVAVDAIFDSVSVGTTYKAKLMEQGIIFCSFSEAVREHPELVQKYLGSVVPLSDNFFAALNSAVFSDGSFVYIPKGVRCPMELSTYFRINTAETGQFERTLIVADEGAYVSYLEGCTAPSGTKTSCTPRWWSWWRCRGDDHTPRCRTGTPATRRAWVGSSTSSPSVARRWKRRRSPGPRWRPARRSPGNPSVILQGDDSVGEFYSVAVVNGSSRPTPARR
jgi:Fe-S cluster assembly protein SufB